MLIKTILNHTPTYGANCFFADNATLIGDVVIGDYCSVWFQAVVLGDVNRIFIGNNVNIQDGAVIHATYKTAPTTIGNNVSIGHNSIVHGCTIYDNVLVGMGAIIMDNAVVESDSIIAAGAVVTKNVIVPSGTVFGGVPAKKIKNTSTELKSGEIARIAKNYSLYASWFKG